MVSGGSRTDDIAGGHIQQQALFQGGGHDAGALFLQYHAYHQATATQTVELRFVLQGFIQGVTQVIAHLCRARRQVFTDNGIHHGDTGSTGQRVTTVG